MFKHKKVSYHQRFYPWLILFQIVIDFITLFAGFLAGFILWQSLKFWHHNYHPLSIFIPYSLFAIVILIFYLRHFKLYERQSGLLNVYELTGIIKAFLLGFMTVLAFSFFYRETEFSRLATVFAYTISFISINIERHLFKKIWRRAFSNERFAQKIVIYGAGSTGQRLAHKIKKNPRLGYHVIGFIDDDKSKFAHHEQKRILGSFNDLEEIFKTKNCSYLFIAMPHLTTEQNMKVIRKCQELHIGYRIVPPTYEAYLEHMTIEDIDGIPLVGIKDKISRRFLIEKKIFDLLLSSIGLILTLPLFPIIMLLIKKESSGL